MADAEGLIAEILRLMPPTLGNEARARANLLALEPAELARLHRGLVAETARLQDATRTSAERFSALSDTRGDRSGRPGLARLRRAVSDIKRDHDT